ncbi:MAG: hypothetical protein GC134_02440 [Proteobacteria bacterium]|nr:hypothetical protein [Pseudomonadota bacterium]
MQTVQKTLLFTSALLLAHSAAAFAADAPAATNGDDVDMIYSYEDALDSQPEAVANSAPAFESAPYITPAQAGFEQAAIQTGVGGPVEQSPDADVAALDEGDPTYRMHATNMAAGASPWDVSLGLALASIPEYMGAKDNDFYVFPFIRAQYSFDAKNKAFFSPYEGLGFKHLLNDSWQVGVRGQLRKNRDSSDDASLNGLPDIDVAVEAGPFVRYTYERLTLGLDVLADVSGEYDGYVVQGSAKVDVPLPVSSLRANFGIETLYGNDDFMDHYFRVLTTQATATRPAFNPGSGFASVGANAMLTYLIDEKWFLTGNLSATKLTGDAADSPLSRDDTNLGGFVAVGYHF